MSAGTCWNLDKSCLYEAEACPEYANDVNKGVPVTEWSVSFSVANWRHSYLTAKCASVRGEEDKGHGFSPQLS